MTIGATPLAWGSKALSEATEYTVTVVKRQGTIRAWVDQDSASIVTYSSSTINDFDSFGLISEGRRGHSRMRPFSNCASCA